MKNIKNIVDNVLQFGNNSIKDYLEKEKIINSSFACQKRIKKTA